MAEGANVTCHHPPSLIPIAWPPRRCLAHVSGCSSSHHHSVGDPDTSSVFRSSNTDHVPTPVQPTLAGITSSRFPLGSLRADRLLALTNVEVALTFGAIALPSGHDLRNHPSRGAGCPCLGQLVDAYMDHFLIGNGEADLDICRRLSPAHERLLMQQQWSITGNVLDAHPCNTKPRKAADSRNKGKHQLRKLTAPATRYAAPCIA